MDLFKLGVSSKNPRKTRIWQITPTNPLFLKRVQKNTKKKQNKKSVILIFFFNLTRPQS